MDNQQEAERTPLEEARAGLSRFKATLGDPGFNSLGLLGQAEVSEIITKLISTPVSDITQDSIIQWTFQLGRIAGIKSTLDRPAAMLAAFEQEVAELEEANRHGARKRNRNRIRRRARRRQNPLTVTLLMQMRKRKMP